VPQGPPFSSIDWPPAVHRQFHLKHSFLMIKAKTHYSFTAMLPHCPHKSSPHLLEQHYPIATISSSHHRRLPSSFPLGAEQHHPIATITTSHHRHLPSGPIVPVYTASLTDMPSPMTAHGSTWQCSKVTPCRSHPHPSPKSNRSLHRQRTGS
jgi:hypothetical protein